MESSPGSHPQFPNLPPYPLGWRTRLILACIMAAIIGGISLEASYQHSLPPRVLDSTEHWLEYMEQQVENFRASEGRYPDSLVELGELRDGWGNPFAYSRSNDSFTLLSLGHDGKPGGIGIDRDVTREDLGAGNCWSPTLEQLVMTLMTPAERALVLIATGGIFLFTLLATRRSLALPRVPLIYLLGMTLLASTFVALMLMIFLGSFKHPSSH